MPTTYWEIALTIIGALGGLGILAFGGGYLISQWKSGSKDDKNAVLESANKLTDFWKEQVDGFREISKQQDLKIADLQKEVSQIHGQLIEKEKQNKEYLEILQNRNPEMLKFMALMTTAAETAQQYREEDAQFKKELHQTLLSINGYMRNINDKAPILDRREK